MVLSFCIALARCTLTSLDTVRIWVNEFLPTDVQLREFFEFVGARPENLDAITRYWLSADTNAKRAKAMRLLWGHRFQTLFKAMLPQYIEQSEKSGALPKTGDRKTSGLIQFFGILSAYAFGYMPREVAVEQLSIRLLNGILWKAERKEERVAVPYTGKRPSSFGPDFALAFITEVTLWAGVPWESADQKPDDMDDDN